MQNFQPKQFCRNWARSNWEVLVVTLAIIYFGLRLAYFATHIHPYIPPDETTHMGRSIAYSKVLFIPENSPETYEFGLVTHRPFLYYCLMGRVLNLNVFSMDDLIFLRLANGLLGVITAVYVFLWIRLVTGNKLVHIVTVIIFTNLLMVTGLFAAISYDNLANLLSAMSVYYLTVFVSRRSANAFVSFLVCILGACLSKKTILPLALILFAVLIIRERRRLCKVPAAAAQYFRAFGAGHFILFLIACIMFIGNVCVYGGNLLKFGHISASGPEILGVDNAMKYRIFAQSYIARQFELGNYSYRTALEKAHEIKNLGDRNTTIAMLQNARDAARIRKSLMHRAQYVTQWFHLMVERTVGYTGHQFLMKEAQGLYPYYIVLFVSGIVLIRKLDLKLERGHIFWSLVITVSYVLVLMWYVNYRTYVRFGLLGLGFTGRYLFPVAMPMFGLTAYHLINFFGRKIQIATVILISAFFIYGDFIFFLRTVPDYWLIR